MPENETYPGEPPLPGDVSYTDLAVRTALRTFEGAVVPTLNHLVLESAMLSADFDNYDSTDDPQSQEGLQLLVARWDEVNLVLVSFIKQNYDALHTALVSRTPQEG